MHNTSSSNSSASATPQSLTGIAVVDRSGGKAIIRSLHHEGDATFAELSLNDGASIDIDLSELERHGESFFYPSLFEQHIQKDERQTMGDVKIPLHQEEVSIDKQRVDTGKGVHVKKHVLENEETIAIPVTEETISIQRIAIGRMLDQEETPLARQEGDTYIVPVFEERYVVEKKIFLREEVHITRKKNESSREEKITLRSEQVSIERFDDNTPPH